jgi:hypothetical protein
MAVVITLDPKLEAALTEAARKAGQDPEALALAALRVRFLYPSGIVPRDEWERGLLEAARDCGVSLSNEAVSSEGIYD